MLLLSLKNIYCTDIDGLQHGVMVFYYIVLSAIHWYVVVWVTCMADYARALVEIPFKLY